MAFGKQLRNKQKKKEIRRKNIQQLIKKIVIKIKKILIKINKKTTFRDQIQNITNNQIYEDEITN